MVARRRRRGLAPATLASLAAAFAIAGCASSDAPVARRSGIDLSAIDASVRPQDDFFRHANGAWLRTAAIPPDRSRIGVLPSLRERIEIELRDIVQDAVRQPADDDRRRIAALYDSFMDEEAVERAGLAPLAGELAAIDGIGSTAELAAAIARLDRLGARMPLRVDVTFDRRDATRSMAALAQSGLLLPDRDYYLLADEPRFAASRAACVAYLTRLLALAGAGDAAPVRADAVFALETALAGSQWTRVASRDPVRTDNKMTVAELRALAPTFAWRDYLAAGGLEGRAAQIVVRQPSYVVALAGHVATTPLPVWKDYLRSHLLDAYAPYLGHEFVAARFAFAATAIFGTIENTPRWQRGVMLVQQSVGEALGRLYVERHFPPESKARMEVLVANLLAAQRDSIAGLDWMSEATRREAQAKLAAFRRKIGYPVRWRDYRGLELRSDDLVGNVVRARAFESARQLAKLGRPVDRDEWQMTPQTVNAYYEESLNEIVFPAAFLQPPLFDGAVDDAANYGAIGAVIGHEISHGFDDEGSQFDGRGNLRVWWTDDDRKRFEAKTRILVGQYSAYSPVPGYTINGELTLGENIADNSGLVIAWNAYRRSLGGKPAPVIDGLSGDERFFYAFAQSFRSKARESALLAQIRADSHSPSEFRVNGVVRNHPGFYATFGVRPGDRMYLAPEQRVSIW